MINSSRKYNSAMLKVKLNSLHELTKRGVFTKEVFLMKKSQILTDTIINGISQNIDDFIDDINVLQDQNILNNEEIDDIRIQLTKKHKTNDITSKKSSTIKYKDDSSSISNNDNMTISRNDPLKVTNDDNWDLSKNDCSIISNTDNCTPNKNDASTILDDNKSTKLVIEKNDLSSNSTLIVKEFIEKIYKYKKLYDNNILSFTEYEFIKKQSINQLNYKIISESSEDFLLELIPLIHSNIISDDDLEQIKQYTFKYK